MSHGVRIYLDRFYQSPNVPAASWWETVDLTLSKALNGDGGGTYAPSSQIIIGGEAGMQFGGPVTLSGGASCQNLLGSGTRFELGDSDYFTFAIAHTGGLRLPLQSMQSARDTSDFTSLVTVANGVASTTTTTTASAPRILLPMVVHDGALLTQVVFSFAVGGTHAGGPPNQMPLFRVYAVALDGTVLPLSTAASNLVNGFQAFPRPASGALWHASGATQTYTYTCDNNPFTNPPVQIDTSKYTYFAEIIDEAGVNAVTGNSYYGITPTFSIGDLRPQ